MIYKMGLSKCYHFASFKNFYSFVWQWVFIICCWTCKALEPAFTVKCIWISQCMAYLKDSHFFILEIYLSLYLMCCFYILTEIYIYFDIVIFGTNSEVFFCGYNLASMGLFFQKSLLLVLLSNISTLFLYLFTCKFGWVIESLQYSSDLSLLFLRERFWHFNINCYKLIYCPSSGHLSVGYCPFHLMLWYAFINTKAPREK